MSRIGKMPIAVPAGVTMEFKDGLLTVKGPKGTLTREVVGNLDIVTEEGNIVLKTLDDSADTNAKHGLYRALLAGMVKGVTDGFLKSLEVKGVGWKAQVQGNKLVLNVGFSHPVEIVAPEGIKFECPSLRKFRCPVSARSWSDRRRRTSGRSESPSLITATESAIRTK